jgi:hypothetical protein
MIESFRRSWLPPEHATGFTTGRSKILLDIVSRTAYDLAELLNNRDSGGRSMNKTDLLILVSIFGLGGLGSLVSAFLGDNGWHLPEIDEGIFRPGWIGNVLVGGLAAVASWAMANSANLRETVSSLQFPTATLANALVIGFGGASWFKSQAEKSILQKTAAVAASKSPDSASANTIATASPMQALKAANNMKD